MCEYLHPGVGEIAFASGYLHPVIGEENRTDKLVDEPYRNITADKPGQRGNYEEHSEGGGENASYAAFPELQQVNGTGNCPLS